MVERDELTLDIVSRLRRRRENDARLDGAPRRGIRNR
jgi:hypothetical protein